MTKLSQISVLEIKWLLLAVEEIAHPTRLWFSGTFHHLEYLTLWFYCGCDDDDDGRRRALRFRWQQSTQNASGNQPGTFNKQQAEKLRQHTKILHTTHTQRHKSSRHWTNSSFNHCEPKMLVLCVLMPLPVYGAWSTLLINTQVTHTGLHCWRWSPHNGKAAHHQRPFRGVDR